MPNAGVAGRKSLVLRGMPRRMLLLLAEQREYCEECRAKCFCRWRDAVLNAAVAGGTPC